MRALAVTLTLLHGCGRLAFDPVDPETAACLPSDVVVEGVMTDELVLGATDTAMTSSVDLPLDRTVLFVSMKEAEPSPTYGAVHCQLVPGAVSCSRLMAGTDYAMSTGEIRVRWTTVTFSQGVSVQRGINTRSPAVALTPVPLSSSFIVLAGGRANDPGASWGTDEFGRAALVDEQTLELRAYSPIQRFSWQVVTMQGASVQRGGELLGAGNPGRDVPIAAVDPAHSFVLSSHAVDTSSGIGLRWELMTASLLDATTIRVERLATNGDIDVGWEVVSMPFAIRHGTSTMGPNVRLVTEPIIGLRPSSAVAIASSQALFGPSGGATDSAGLTGVTDLVGEAAVTLTPAADSLVVERATALSTATIPWSVIDFGCDP